MHGSVRLRANRHPPGSPAGRAVWWSIPKSWVPGGVSITHEDALEATRLLSRTSRSRARNALLEPIGSAVPDPFHTDRLALIEPREL